MHILLASLLLTTVSPAYSSSALHLPPTYSDGADDGYANRIESVYDDFYPQYGRDHDGAIRVAAGAGFTIEEFEASSDDLLPSDDDSTNTRSTTRPSSSGLTDNLKNMGPCCPPSSPGSSWMSGATFCQQSVWKDRNGNGKLDPEEQIIRIYETGHRDLKTGQCKVGPILGPGGKARQPSRARSQPKSRNKPRNNTRSGTSSSSGNSARSGTLGTTFDCDIGLQSMGVRVRNKKGSPRFAKINHYDSGNSNFYCYYRISGVKGEVSMAVNWIRPGYKVKHPRLYCSQGLTRVPAHPNIIGDMARAYFSHLNGKAAYVDTWDKLVDFHKKTQNLDIIGVNRFKAFAEKILAQIEPHAVDCPR